MTSQAERIKAFKLAQHARLRKQDDEEQWISSEELCTEGSSDEESHSSTTSHRKIKRNKPQKRGISPLAQLPKKEPTSPNLQECNYLLPEPLQSAAIKPQSHSNKSVDKFKSSDSEESIDGSEIEKMIQWRPKRGSIKLPDFPEGRSIMQDLDMHEMDTLYTEMSIVIRQLKERPLREKSYLFPDISDKEVTEVCIPKKQATNRYITSELRTDISGFDSKIYEKHILYQKMKEERKVAQKEMCMVILNDLEPNRDMQKFLELCHFELGDTEEIEDSKETQPKVHAKTFNQNFVLRNIHLAKFYSMDKSSLTDEEKLNLESLLSDDGEEFSASHANYLDNKTEKQDVNKPHHVQDSSDCNYFQLRAEEQSLMDNITTQLQEILRSYGADENDISCKLENPADDDALDRAINEGKLWKQDQLQQRLESIQKSLNQIAITDAEEQEKLDSIRTKSNTVDNYDTELDH